MQRGVFRGNSADLHLRGGSVYVNEKNKILDKDGLSTSQLRRLSRDLGVAGDWIRRINATILNPKYDLLWAPPDADKQAARERMAHYYDSLPAILQIYSKHLQDWSKFCKVNLRRITFAQYFALKLLHHIQDSTNTAHYDAAAKLLQAGVDAVAGEEKDNTPTFFSAEALSKLAQRFAKLRYKT